MAKKVGKKVVEESASQEVSEEVNLLEKPPVEEIEKVSKEPGDFDKVRVNIPFELKIGGKRFSPGSHIVERHMIATIVEMVDKKRRADLAIFTGKNFFVERLVDNTLKVTEVENLDLKKMVR